MTSIRKIRFQYLILLILGLILGHFSTLTFPPQKASAKIVTISSRGWNFKIISHAENVESLLKEQGIVLTSDSVITVDVAQTLTSGTVVDYRLPVELVINDAGVKTKIKTTALTVAEVLAGQGITLSLADKLSFKSDDFIYDGQELRIDRINEAEEKVLEPVAYRTEIVEDSNVFYGREQVINLGKEGSAEVTYKVTYKNGVEAGRKKLSAYILNDPVNRIISRGTKIEVESYELGKASWYAYKKCLCAAHPYFPLDSYLKVTGITLGKSVIVKVNDRGPVQSIHPDRLIDLDAEAYKMLAPLGSGVLDVKVEKLK